MTDEKKIGLVCQSCGMELDDQCERGTEADGKPSADYCRRCYQNGRFTEPELTKEDVLARVIDKMALAMFLPAKKAREVALATVPGLKRWKKE